MDDPVWHPTTFTKNRDRLLAMSRPPSLMRSRPTPGRPVCSRTHFTVDGTQLEAWASLKSFRCRDAAPSAPPDDPGNPTGLPRRAAAQRHAPRRLIRRRCCIGRAKGRRRSWPATCCWIIGMGSANVCATHATGTAEREAAALLLEASAPPGSTVGQTRATMWRRCSGTSRPTGASAGVRLMVGPPGMRAVSGNARGALGGWTVGGLRKLRHRGVPLVDWQLTFTGSACGIWRRRVPDRRPRVSPAPSSGSAHTRAHCRRSVVTRMMLKKTARYPGSSAAC